MRKPCCLRGFRRQGPGLDHRAGAQGDHRRDEHQHGEDHALADPLRGQGLRHRPLRRRGAHARADREPADPELLAEPGLQAHIAEKFAATSIRATSSSTTTSSRSATRTTTSRPSSRSSSRTSWSRGRRQGPPGGHRRRVRGGYNPNATEVWQEALRIPAVKVYERGELRKDVWDLIFANIRLDIVQEDMRAEIGSCTVGERRLVALIEKYGLERFEAHKSYLFDATRKMMEAEIRSIPNGVYPARRRSTSTARTPARSTRSASRSPSRTSTSSSTTRTPTRRRTGSSTGPTPRARRRPS